MPVPKRKRSKRRRDQRFANKGIKPQSFGACSNCNDVIAPHSVCKGCGFYRGRKILTTKAERTVTRGLTRKAQSERAAQRMQAGSAASSQQQ